MRRQPVHLARIRQRHPLPPPRFKSGAAPAPSPSDALFMAPSRPQDPRAFNDSCIGLLVVWGAVRLCWHAIAAHEQQVRAATHSTTASSCNCDWRGRMLTMCAWSKQLKDGGSWVPVEEFFNRHFKIRISHGVCEQIRDGLIGQAGEMRLADEVQTAPVQRC
jgi:hypothetical protein